MPYLNIPLSGIPRAPACDKEATQDFINKRAQMRPDQVAVVERLVESFNTRPSTTGDIEIPGTPIGTARARVRDGAYVLYQQFSQHGQTKVLIKLWYCGAYDIPPGSGKFDFQTEYKDTDGA
jgi:hypothetical protein